MGHSGAFTTLFVDLDNTLHDYEAAAQVARAEVMSRIAETCQLSPQTVAAVYDEILNTEIGVPALSGRDVRLRRFVALGQKLGVQLSGEDLAGALAKALLGAVRPARDAVQTLKALAGRCRVVILTEGYPDVQADIAAKLGLTAAGFELFVTYAHGVRKRDGTAYQAALEKYGSNAGDVAMIGDNWDWDIIAASQIGLHQIWISHGKALPPPPPLFLGVAAEIRFVPALLAPKTGLQFNILGLSHHTFEGQLAFDFVERDGFGNFRQMPKCHATLTGMTAAPAAPIAISEPDILAMFVRQQREIYVTGDTDLIAALVKLKIDKYWPLFRNVKVGEPTQQNRLVALRDTFPAGYEQTLRATDPKPECLTLVAGLKSAIEDGARDIIFNSAFGQINRVRRVLTVGSTSRETYCGFPVDFDLVVETDVLQARIDRNALAMLSDRICDLARAHPYYALYEQKSGFTGGSKLIRTGFGARGKESFVVRYECVASGGAAAATNFLDITFGRLPQLTGYEIWFQRFVNGLLPAERLHLRREIRLAKLALSNMGDLYGSKERGFRGHMAEQWIIQSYNYRFGGFAVGTLDNALRLIAEEGGGEFSAYKKRFPLWHPGWWEPSAALDAEIPAVDLWDFLGDGDPATVTRKWTRLCALAKAHVEAAATGTWSICDVTGRTKRNSAIRGSK